MGKRNIKISDNEHFAFPSYKSYSVEEIMAAGGPTSFAEKRGKTGKDLVEALKKLPKEAFLTDDEANIALKMLSEGK